MRAYGKVTLKAHEKTNCATEILFPEAEEWARDEINLKGPLAGIPVSLKDSIQVKGFDISIGFSSHTGKPYAKDGPMVQLLKEAGKFSRDLQDKLVDLIRRRTLCEDKPTHNFIIF